MIFEVFCDRREVVLDGGAVWGIQWQQQQRDASVLNQLHRVWRCVKRGVVHDDQMLAGQRRIQPRLEPGVEHLRIARAFEEAGVFKLGSDTGGDE